MDPFPPPASGNSQHSPSKWTTERLAEAALGCETRGAFKDAYPGAYNQAIKYGVLDAICAHMTLRYQTWSDEKLSAEAAKYSTRKEFRAGSPNAYAAAIRQKKLPGLAELFRSERTGIGNHMVYRLRFSSCVYIGLTCTAEVRKRYHLIRGVVARHLKSTGEELPKMELIADNLSPEEASLREIREIKQARDAGENLLNTAGGGQLGAFGRSLWPKERVMTEARKYKTRTEFKLKARTAFSHARDEGWLEEVCLHMEVLRKTYSNNDLVRMAKRFSSRSALQKYEPSAYHAARSRGILDHVCRHMSGSANQSVAPADADD